MSAFEDFGAFGGYFNTAGSAGVRAGLTLEKLRESMQRTKEVLKEARPPRPALGGLLSQRHFIDAMPIITNSWLPDEQPAIQVRPIRLKDGTELLSTEFLTQENAWWKEQYGMRMVAFVVNGQMVAHPRVHDMMVRAAKAVDDQLLSMILGRQP